MGTPYKRAEVAKELKQDQLGISDHGNLIGAPIHIKACNQHGIKPVVGVEAYFKPDRHKKDNDNKKSWHLLLIAQNQQGWNNLIKITSESHTSGFYYKPCVDWELLRKYGEGIICSSACISGYLPWLIQQNESTKMHDCIEQHLDIFGDRYRLEIMPHDLPAQKLVNNQLAKLSLDYDIPLLATNDSHMPYKTWSDTQDVVLMIATGQSLSQRKAKKEAGEDVYQLTDVKTLHMMDEAEMAMSFSKYHPELTKNTVLDAIEESAKLSETIEPIEIDRSNKFPKPKKDVDSYQILLDWCEEGMKRIGKVGDPVYEERLAHELKTFKDMEVVEYFILVGSLVRWAREEKIRVSSGRGSAAGSLVCYLIKITSIDPIGHNLLFERFMNPDRKGMPDIDIDFQDDRRDEVKKKAAEIYGEDRVADILALGTYGPKGALKDVSRVLDVSYVEINAVTKLIPDPPNVPTLETLRRTNNAIGDFAKKYPEVWKHAIRIEGQSHQLSKHAAGVVICDKPITDYMPLIQGKSGIVTSWSDRADEPVISEFGFPKIDFLSIDGLTKQGNTINLIEEMTGEHIDLDELGVTKDPNDIDPEVFKLFRRGLTLGIWQFGGSRGIANFMRKLKPDRFQDLSAANALYRPGPLDGGDAFKYAERKRGEAPVEYWHPSVEPFLEETYGIMCYQEQLMEIVKALGNFTPGEADDMRKACSKLYRVSTAEAQNFMKQYADKWFEGTKEHGIDQPTAQHIWDLILAFGGYSFNKSHASSYSLLSYQDAWLKTYYTLPFYASLLSRGKQSTEEVVREAGMFGVEVMPPDINRSDAEFTIEDNQLLYGLLRVKFIGDLAMGEILKHRPFKGPQDLYDKCDNHKITMRSVNYLVSAGAFDFMGIRDDVSVEEKREQEKEALGVSISGAGDSLQYSEIIEPRINSEDEFENMNHGDSITVGGEVISVNRITTKTGKPMAFATISYKENSWECTIFPEPFKKYDQLIGVGKSVMVRGTKDDRGSVTVQKIASVEELAKALENV